MGNQRYALLPLAMFGFLGLLVLMRWPALGIMAIFIGGFFTQYVGPGGFNLALIAIMAVLAAWFIKMIIVERQIQFVRSRAMRPLFFFIIVSLLSFGLGQLPWYSFAGNAPTDAQFGGLVIFLLSAGTFLAVANLIKEQKWLERITWLFLGLGGLFIAAQFMGATGGYITRYYHIDLVSGSMFWTWLVAIAFSQALINNRLHVGWRLLLGVLAAATLYIAYFTNSGWKSGYLPALFAVGTIVMLRYWRVARFSLIFTVIPIWYLANQAIASDQYSWSTRIEAWLIVSEIAKISPILGLGFANYYWYTPFFPIRGYFISFNSHSQYVDLFAQTGILGIIGFLWFFFEVGRVGLDLRKRAAEGFPIAYVYGAIGGLVATLVAASLVDWVLPFVYNIGLKGFRASIIPWIFLGGLISIEQIIRRSKDRLTS